MKVLIIVSAFVSLTAAAAAPSNGNGNGNGNDSAPCKPVSTRPTVVAHPKQPRLPIPIPPPRNKVCCVKTHGDGVTDDSTYIMSAFHACNHGGHVVFRADTTYLVGTAMDWTFLKDIDIGGSGRTITVNTVANIPPDIQGTIQFTNDTDYWQANSFRFGFQNVTSFFKLGGENVFVYGGGTLHGNGQVWYDLHAQDTDTLRPVLVGIDGLQNSVVADLHLRLSPMYYHFVANASNVVFSDIDISISNSNGGASSSAHHAAKNTDGWDTYRSSDIAILNSVVVNGDDCVSLKPNSTHILVASLSCTGSHGISIGSLGQYAGAYDIVEHVWVGNVSLHAATDGARIKVWPNTPSALSGDLQGGGGGGRVRNITYDGMYIDGVDYAIEITQCYGQKNLTVCQQHPSSLTLADVVFRNFYGVTSTKYAPQIAALACSSTATCRAISATNIDVVSPRGGNQAYCLNQNATALDLTCTDVWKGFN
ncbi:extracellular exo-polygalacturonase [Sporothrix schenckii 1099-18]|uniref:galacturonan 1,4-alpha-galacturonidase n=1 Tax=Sporothrix schenckii 1099-18 TaxID=1397361 RepID=A0A0F2MLB4_SPOSC|nr:extracellular exo-polygalacturonase [Sporothrix schenckii 1099-18]KJR88961.1 extracellular exo-polygalacturonase [Sporothrix schenckii 1099-18]